MTGENHRHRIRGVSLVEMSLVLMILGILMRAAVTPLAGAQQQRDYRRAETGLQEIQQGIWAHVVATGALPCPVVLSQQGILSGVSASAAQGETFTSDQRQPSACQLGQGGVPARLLGLAGATDANGALLDPWDRPYRLAVSMSSHDERGSLALPDWTTPGEASSVGIAELSADLLLCHSSADRRCAGSDIRANHLSFVLFSTGEDHSSRGVQAENLDTDAVFILRERSIRPEDPFDDQLVWGTAAETLYWMLRAGWLP